MQDLHYSVLREEVLSIFRPLKLYNFLDGTLGAGGHAQAILNEHPELITYYGIDQDPEALAIAQQRLKEWKAKMQFIRSNFSEIREMPPLNGILLDLGVSSMQLDRPEKGFSFMREGPLDMRMDPSASLTAEEIVNTWSEEQLVHIFRVYGEEPKARQAAQAIIKRREQAPFKSTKELADLMEKIKKREKIHPATLIFQALRICVNGELEVIEKSLVHLMEMLVKTGRMAVITFHSLEDRLVKNIFRYLASDKEDSIGLGGGIFIDKQPTVKLLTRKPILPSEKEIALNPRSRSAKLRVIEKL